MNINELKQELIHSLPSKKMIEAVSVGAVEIEGRILILKQRPNYDFNKGECILYSENHGWDYPYDELVGKSVIFNDNLIGRRGKEAIERYFK